MASYYSRSSRSSSGRSRRTAELRERAPHRTDCESAYLMFAIRDIFIFGVVAGVLGTGGLLAWPWGRIRGRFLVGGIATFLGFIAWNLTLNHANATGFNVDAPVIQVSWADSGSGVMAFAVTALALAIYERHESAGRVVGTAATCGALALILDIFVL
jgi:hypothetical protein